MVVLKESMGYKIKNILQWLMRIANLIKVDNPARLIIFG